MRALWGILVALVLLLSCVGSVHAAPHVPAPLEPWRAWVLHEQPPSCSKLPGETEPSCMWPSKLSLQVTPTRGTFTLDAYASAPGWLRLPGDAKYWPVAAILDQKPAVVLDNGGLPSIYLEPGHHVVSGELLWTTPPESLPVPRDVGIVTLAVGSPLAPVEFPNRDENGALWLQSEASEAMGDQLELTVHRKLADDVPMELVTRLSLNVAGKSREVLLGKVLPAEFVALNLESPLPARLEPDGHLRVQVRPGTWTLTLTARSRGPVQSITRPSPEGIWREGNEVWTFEAKNDLRIVSLDGAPPIDPGQTSLPQEWRSFPAFAVGAGGTLSFHERQRGDANPSPDRLHVSRSLWLDFSGDGFTFRDSIRGELNRSWRLEVGPGVDLGRVSVAGRDVHITRNGAEQPAGVEVRQGHLNLFAEGRIEHHGSTLPAAVWNHDFEGAELAVHLPPGWELVHARGVDAVSDSWIHRWRLLEIFLALLLGAAFFRLFGRNWGLLAAAGMVLTLTVPNAPRWTWFLPLALEAIGRVAKGRLGDGKLRAAFDALRVLAVASLALVAIPFAIEQVRGGFYPALEALHDTSSLGTRSVSDNTGASLGAEMEAAAPVSVPSAQAPAEMPADRKDEAYDALRSRAKSVAPMGNAQARQFNTSEYDPNAVVQVGPGVPTWSWRSVQLIFNGPIRHDQNVQLYLLPPAARLPLALLRVALLALLFARLLSSALPRFAPKLRGFAPALLLACAIGLTPTAARAEDYPSNEMLEELKRRLLSAPPCGDACVDVSRLALEVSAPAQLRLRLEVGALAPAALPLPGRLGQWTPSAALLDDHSAPLRRTEAGLLVLDVPPGTHRIELSGPLPAHASIPLDLPKKPRVASATLSAGWTLDGIHDDGRIDDTLQLSRSASEGGKELQPATLPSFVRVERTLHVGLNWQVETKVIRATPLGAAISLEIPLLAGESVTTADIRVENGKVIAQLPRDATELSWQSVLAEKSPILLTAAKTLEWSERWQLDVSPMWHAELSGLPVTHRQVGGVLLPDWRPWPGEEARIDITRPEGVGGQTLAIDGSQLAVKPGLRATDVQLVFQLRASRGGEHSIELPEGSDLQNVTMQGREIPLRLEGRTLTLPVRPGSDTVVVRWREPRGISLWFTPSTVDLKLPSVNGSVNVQLADESRWILFLSGPRLGPAVLFWSFFVVLLLVSYGLSRARSVPLKMWEWALLGLGVSQSSPWAAAAIAGWLLALAWRGKHPDLSLNVSRLVQIALVFWTAVAFFVLLASIHQGLLGFPSMRIEGNNSSESNLHWYVDRLGPTLAVPQVLSVPILVYRLVMLLWALWLAFAVMRWVRWGFANFVAGGAWKAKPIPVVVPPPATAPKSAPPAPPPAD